jgi:nucleotide-binding universal stress UspA family protein
LSDITLSRPQRILVATDLTVRCDRAVDRALQLAKEFGAEVIAAYIMDPADTPQHYLDHKRRAWRRIPDPVERMRWRLKRDLAAASDEMRAVVAEGDPAEKLVEIAIRENCDLILTGAVRAESLARMVFGSTVNRIVRATYLPVLMVNDRVAAPYHNIVVTTDFSDASILGLRTAAAYFPTSSLTLFHGYDIPYAGFVVDRDIHSELRVIEDEVTASVLSDPRIEPDLRERTQVVIEHGCPEALLGDYIENHDIHLTVIGSHGRGALFDALIGSTAKRLAEAIEGDLLIVRYIDPAR